MLNRIKGISGFIAAGLFACSAFAAPPANDNFASRTVLGGTQGSCGTTIDATLESGEPTPRGFGDERSVWYGYNASSSGVAKISVSVSNMDPAQETVVYRGSTLTALTNVVDTVASSSGTKFGSLQTFQVLGGEQYKAQVITGLPRTPGPFCLTIEFAPSPSNDLFANRITLAGATGMVNGTLTGAGRELNEPTHQWASESTIWYEWTAPFAGNAKIDVISNVIIGGNAKIYRGSALNSLTPVATQQSSLGGNSSRHVFPVQTGDHFVIAVYGPYAYTTNVPMSLRWGQQQSADEDIPTLPEWGVIALIVLMAGFVIKKQAARQ